MEPAAGAEDFFGVILERVAAGEGGNLVAHDVLSTKAGETFANFDLRDAFLGGVQDKKADEGSPKTLGDLIVKNSPDAEENHDVGDNLSGSAGDASGGGEILFNAPNDGSEDATAVEREAWQKIECAQV